MQNDNVLMYYVFRDFLGPEYRNFGHQCLKIENYFEKQFWIKDAQNMRFFNYIKLLKFS